MSICTVSCNYYQKSEFFFVIELPYSPSRSTHVGHVTAAVALQKLFGKMRGVYKVMHAQRLGKSLDNFET